MFAEAMEVAESRRSLQAMHADLDSIEENHDAYFDQGEVAISRAVARLLN